MHKTSYKRYLDKCMPSLIMRNYLKVVDLSPRQVVDIIMYSPTDIDVKMEELGRIAADKTNDVLLQQMASEAIKGMQEALSVDEKRCCYSLELMDYCENIQDIISALQGIYGSVEDVKDFYRGLIESYNYTDRELGWSKLKKWEENKDGDYEVVHTYIFRGDKIVFATNNPWVSKKEEYGYYESQSLNLPVPFKVGDILEFDGYDLGPGFRALILSIGDNESPDCVQGLSLVGEGGWSTGSLKAGELSIGYHPKISYLYSAKHVEGELPDNERVLLEVQEQIKGDDNKGIKLMEMLKDKSVTEEELKEIIGKI